MVVNIGRVLSGKWEYVEKEIRAINQVVVDSGAILKVIFENDCEFLNPSHHSASRLPFHTQVGKEEDTGRKLRRIMI